MERYYFLPISYKAVLKEYNFLTQVELSQKYLGYYVPENLYLILQNNNKL